MFQSKEDFEGFSHLKSRVDGSVKPYGQAQENRRSHVIAARVRQRQEAQGGPHEPHAVADLACVQNRNEIPVDQQVLFIIDRCRH